MSRKTSAYITKQPTENACEGVTFQTQYLKDLNKLLKCSKIKKKKRNHTSRIKGSQIRVETSVAPTTWKTKPEGHEFESCLGNRAGLHPNE